jgi:hypothetical protein
MVQSLNTPHLLGAGGGDHVYDLAQDSQSGEVYLCGEVRSPTTGFPITANALFPIATDISSFVSIFDPADNTLTYSTFFPASQNIGNPTIHTILPVGDRQIWISGVAWGNSLILTDDAIQDSFGGGESDGFYSLLDLRENQLVYSSYLGGADRDAVWDMAILSSNRVVLSGTTCSVNFPVTANAYDTSFNEGVYDGFVTIIQGPDSLQYSTYLGGRGEDQLSSVLLNPDETVIVCGYTPSTDFPVTTDGMDTICNSVEGFVCKLSANLSEMDYGTFVGGSNQEYLWCGLLDGQDSVWVGGLTRSTDYPVTPDAFQPICPDNWASNFLTHLAIGTGSGIGGRPVVFPTSVSISSFPNPFNATTNILFTLSTRSYVTLRVFDVMGRTVQSVDLGWMNSGRHREQIDGTNLASGVYFLRLDASSILQDTRLMLLK